MTNRTRNIVIVGVVIVALGLIVWMSASAARSTGDLAASLRRRSPVTDYTAAEFGHNDCRKNYEDAYLAAIGRALTSPPNDPARTDALTAVQRYTDVLAHIEQHCPTPGPPVFDEDGTLIEPPYIPATTTSTTLQPKG